MAASQEPPTRKCRCGGDPAFQPPTSLLWRDCGQRRSNSTRVRFYGGSECLARS